MSYILNSNKTSRNAKYIWKAELDNFTSLNSYIEPGKTETMKT